MGPMGQPFKTNENFQAVLFNEFLQVFDKINSV